MKLTRKSLDYPKDEFTRINFAWSDRRRQLSARLAAGSEDVAAGKRITVHGAGESTTRELQFQRRPIEIEL